MSVPAASAISHSDSASIVPIDMDDIISSVKTLEAADLFKLIKAVVAEAEKKSKISAKGAKTAKKTGSAPKGVIPTQLKKPRAWVEFTLKDAIENGWESFTVHQTKKDKTSGEKVEEEIEMSAAVQNDDGAWVYEDSITDKSPKGKQIIHKEAMSLSKQRKTNNHPSWAAFEASYVEDEDSSDDSKSTSNSSTKTVVRKTAAEKAAEMESKKAAKEAEKVAAKEAKEAEKAAAKAAKEAEKVAAKAAKEAEKEAAKSATKKPVAAPKKPVAAPKKPEASVAPAPAPAPVKTIKTVKPAAPKEEIPADGLAHPWTFKGKKCLRTSDNEVWEAKADGSMGKWLGLYDPTTEKIDASAEEPEFADEE